MRKFYLLILIGLFNSKVFSQTSNDILNVLVSNKTITQEQADSLRAEAAIKQQEADASKKSFFTTAARQIQFSGYTQFHYQNLDEPGKINGFDIRRTRLSLKGNISPYWGYAFQTEFAVSPKLLDAYVDCKIADYFQITAGQFKIPFSIENLLSSSKLDMIDRSQIVEALTARGKDVIGNQNGRDIGVQIGGAFLKLNDRALIDYRLGLFNGNGINTFDVNESKDVVARLIFHPIKGLDLGGSYLNGLGYYSRPTTAAPTNHRRNRYGLELAYEWQALTFRSEFIRGEDSYNVKEGWYAQAGYFILPQKLQILLKYDTYNPSISTPNDKSTLYIVSANYFFNNYSKLQAGYVYRKEEKSQINNNIFQIQYQIGF